MTTTSVAEAFLGRLADQDAEAIGALFADEIDWFVPGDSAFTPWTGARARGGHVPGYFTELWAALAPGRSVVSVDAIIVDGHEAVIVATFDHVAETTGRAFRTPAAMRLTVVDDRIVRMHLFEDTAAVAAAFEP